MSVLIHLAWCAHEPARLHSCSKFTTPGSYYSLNIVPHYVNTITQGKGICKGCTARDDFTESHLLSGEELVDVVDRVKVLAVQRVRTRTHLKHRRGRREREGLRRRGEKSRGEGR